MTERLLRRVRRARARPAPGGGRRLDRNGEPLPHVEGALDCDLGLLAADELHAGLGALGGESADHVMAWVALPDLGVTRSEQRYEPIDDRRVRFVSLDNDFTAELELDEDGLVVRYPRLAERVVNGARA